ncbi:nuclear envelope integral membrane protein 1-like [Branchiostoma floridae]|uniref:Nuclear envelope integral membrane protein 1-like n=1 Tax=Branchiostoma floridae TaxID=7739 RepID=A0A9J7KGM6_BRAFL|nr:nuclear envelope integral membrane protein 1-like [Branchiostoma floridae]
MVTLTNVKFVIRELKVDSAMPVIGLVLFFFLASVTTVSADCGPGFSGVRELTKKTPSYTLSTDEGSFQVFCYSGEAASPFLLWSSVTVRVKSLDGAPTIYVGHNKSEVCQKQDQQNLILYWLMISPDKVSLPPFERSCVGVEYASTTYIGLDKKAINVWSPACLVFGLLIFSYASTLSRNVLFYYSSGITVGVLASLLILVYMLSKLVPKKSGAVVLLAAGWSTALYLLQHMYLNLQSLLQGYLPYILGYLAVAALVSFAVCYRYGPVTNERSLDLIKWGIQLIGLTFVYNGTQLPAASLTIILLAVLWANIPERLAQAVRYYWRTWFPRKIRRLTQEEYEQQAREETRRALEQLRQFCNSPDCNTWKTVSRLEKCSPVRFAKFVEGDSHLSEDEVCAYDSEVSFDLPMEDSFEEDESFVSSNT